MYRRLIILLFSCLMAASCVYPYTAELQSTETLLVVEGDILIGSVSEFELSYVKALGSGSALMNSPYAELTVEGSDGSVFTGKCVGGHGSVDTRSADASASYRLLFTTPNGNYETDWMEPCSKPVIKDISYKVDDDNLTVCLTCDSEDSHYVLYVDETWEYRSAYMASLMYVEPKISGALGSLKEVDPEHANHYCWSSSAMPQKLLSASNPGSGLVPEAAVSVIPRTDRRISYLYRISMELRSVSEGKYNYLSFMEKSSSNAGDLFAPTPSSIAGNIRCTGNPDEKVVGYVDVTYAVMAKKYISISEHQAYRNTGASPEPVVVPSINWYSKYLEGYLPYYKNEKDGDCYWVEARCVDCRLAGGTTEKPEDWPDE